jgi:hypothetical protein
MHGKTWTVAIRRQLVGEGAGGLPLALTPGLYTLREVGLSQYELCEGGMAVCRLSFSQVRQYRNERAVQIYGHWP